MEREKIKKAKRIVIKVGASVLTRVGGVLGCPLRLDEVWIRNFSKQVAALFKEGRQVIVVSSGAIAAGMGLLGMKKRPKGLPEQQACAALGQGHLMKMYEEYFKKKDFKAKSKDNTH